MRNNDTILKTLIVAVTLCLVCSAVISSVAVGLRDLQEANKKLDQQTKILAAAQLLDETKTVQELFTSIEAKIVNLETGGKTPKASAVKNTITRGFPPTLGIIAPGMKSKGYPTRVFSVNELSS